MTEDRAAQDQARQGQARRGQAVEIAVAWTVVGIPLAYGVFNSVKAALELFSG